MKAYHIDSVKRTITQVEYNGLGDLHKLLDGHIEVAYLWSNGDCLYVDEEGLLKPNEHFFAIPTLRSDQAFAGSGVIVGREINDTANTAPPTITAAELLGLVEFMDRREVLRRVDNAKRKLGRAGCGGAS